MPTPTDHRLDDFLAAPQADAWRDRLAAAFFDADACEPILQEVRDALRNVQPPLPDDQRQPFHDLAVAALCADASRRAVPLSQDAEALTGEALTDRVVNAYPSPVARPYLALTEADPGAGAFGCLLDAFEGLVHFLAMVAVSAYQRSGLALPECNRHLVERFLKGAWATGDLFALLRDTVRLVGDCGGHLPYPELPGYLLTPRGKPSDSCRVLESFVALRNRRWGHGTGRTDAAFAEALPVNRRRLDAELARLHWLTAWEFVRPLEVDAAGALTRAHLLMGHRRNRPYAGALRLQDSDLDVHGGAVRPQTSLLLVSPDRGRYLPLFPLSLFGVALNRHDGVYLLQGCRWRRGGRPRRVERATYVAYEADLAEREERADDAAATHLERLVEHLEAQLPPGTAETTAPAPREDPTFDLPEVRAEQEYHLRQFLGREDLLRELAAWIDGATRGGYLLLLGPPGQGKSALMAELARRESDKARGGCLLHMVKSHPNPLRFLPALVGQAARLAGTRFGEEAYRGDVADLRSSLVHAAEAVREHTGRALLVIDALDELAGGDEGRTAAAAIDFLPRSLPAGVHVVLSCRPDVPLVEALRARLVGLKELPVPPLTEDDFRLLLERRLEVGVVRALAPAVDFGAVFRQTGGNPLFLHAAVDHIADEVAQAAAAGRPPRVEVADLPASLGSFFREVYQSRVAGKVGTQWVSEEGRGRARLMQFLCVAREALGFEELAGLMAADQRPLSLEDCRDRVDEMSQFLLDAGGGRFRPWHKGLADYVVTQVLGADSVRQTEERFCDWLAKGAGGGYGLRHRVSHLLAAGRHDGAAALLTDLPYLEGKAEAGLVFELAVDFAQAVAALPATHPHREHLWLIEEALRSDLHFIARHPSALFQCLWNRCWWYDCPESAEHYEPRREPLPTGLFRLLEQWRAAKERATPGFVWVRSLRPPRVHLGTALRAVLTGHEHWVTCVSFAPDGGRLASASEDRTVRLWDAVSGRELACLRGHEQAVASVAFAPDGQRLASGSRDGTVRLWDAGSGRELACLRGHEGQVNSVAFAPDGGRLASGSRDGTVRLWDTAGGRELACLRGHEDDVNCVAFAPDGVRLASAGDRTVRLWGATSGHELACLRGHHGGVYSVAFAPDGARLASASSDGTVRLWDAASGHESACLRGHQGWVSSVTFAPDGARLASASADGTVRLWEATGGRELACLRGHESVVHSVAFAPDGVRLASASADETVRLWDAAGGRELAGLRGHEKAVYSVAFAPDGGRLASGSRDGTVRLWDAASGRELACLRGHESWVSSVAFAPDGQRLASGSRDGTVRLWDAASGRELACLRGHKGRVYSVAFAPDGARLTSASTDRTVRLWDAASGRCLEVIQGKGDMTVLAGGDSLTPLRAVSRALETAIEAARTGEAVAWFRGKFDHLTTHSGGRLWAGSIGSHVYLIALAGATRPERVEPPGILPGRP